MSKVYQRPMFRMGGSVSKGTGITSGLDYSDRMGFQEGGAASPFGLQKKEPQTVQEKLAALEKELAENYKLSRSEDLRQRAVALAKGFSGAKTIGEGLAGAAAAREEMLSPREKELRDIKAKMKTAPVEFEIQKELEKQKGTSGRTYALEVKIGKIGQLNKEIDDLNSQKNKEGITQQEIDKINREIEIKQQQLKTITEDDPFVTAFLKTEAGAALYDDTIDALEQETNPTTGEFWKRTDPGFYQEVFKRVKRSIGAGGFQDGGQVTAPMAQTPMAENQDFENKEIKDEDIMQVSYAELRARLPKEITNDIVQLVSKSREALVDFANIKTQQDVDNFNRKFNVNLVLPQEG